MNVRGYRTYASCMYMYCIYTYTYIHTEAIERMQHGMTENGDVNASRLEHQYREAHEARVRAEAEANVLRRYACCVDMRVHMHICLYIYIYIYIYI
jgi:hypothetical protein